MKNLFTFIVALFMATSVYAETYKSFTETTVLITNQANVHQQLMKDGHQQELKLLLLQERQEVLIRRQIKKNIMQRMV